MFTLSFSHTYYLYLPPTDMRKSFDSGIVHDELLMNPLNGSVYIFINKRGDKLKLLYWLGMSFTLYYKRLEEGSFELPSYEGEIKLPKLSYTQLVMIIDGLSIVQLKKRQRFSLQSYTEIFSSAH